MTSTGYYVTMDDAKLELRTVFVEMIESKATKFFGAGIPCFVVEIPRPQCGTSLATCKTTEMQPWLWALR